MVVADGAGGLAGGERAAEFAVDALAQGPVRLSQSDWEHRLLDLDQALARHPGGGQTTVVAVFIDAERIVGASVGDSNAWLIRREGTLDLTEGQRRKPLLGSGEASPVGFEAGHGTGRLLLGSDGLFKYAPSHRIETIALDGPVETAAEALTCCVRLPSGALHDDVAVILAAVGASIEVA